MGRRTDRKMKKNMLSYPMNRALRLTRPFVFPPSITHTLGSPGLYYAIPSLLIQVKSKGSFHLKGGEEGRKDGWMDTSGEEERKSGYGGDARWDK